MKPAPRRVHTGQRILDDAQSNGREALRRQNAAPFDGGVLLTEEIGTPPRTGLNFTAGTARAIVHGLGRPAVGWMEVYGVDAPSAARVGLYASALPSGLTSSTHVAVTPTSSGTAFLFIF